MKNKSALNHLDLWKDICFYEVYMDMIEYEDYLIYLSNKYSIDIDDIVVKIDEVKREVNKKIKEHQEQEKDKEPLFKTACEEETIKIIMQYNRDRETIKEIIFEEPSLTVNKIKKLGFSKTRK